MSFPHIVHTCLHVLVVLLLPPFLLGVINRTKAKIAGRVGPPLLQVYFDIAKQLRKDSVFSETTTSIFRFGPVVGLVTALAAAAILPMGHDSAPLSFGGDVLLFAYVLALGRFFTMAAALDTGSAFEGMGAAREATFACLAEPVLFMGLLVLSRVVGSVRMSTMLGDGLAAGWVRFAPPLLLVVASWFLVLLVENSRIPLDDPNTHLELTMIHEVMVLDHSGPALALVTYGASIKLLVFCALIVNLVLPFGTGHAALDWLVFLGGTLGLAVFVGVIESIMARLVMSEIPRVLVGAGMVSLLAVILAVSTPR